ncbi:MAG: class I SAM-dependent methyltransferase [Frankiaceae bacterium]|nr:class I SAM-dependent methyltransferase [Frankiaceae bacterium]MBV9368477.1 class I SAM-dependent methyltransferase [Frankiales bacterium]
MPTNDEIRDAQRATWARLSPSWDKWDALIMEQLRPARDAIVESLDVHDGQHHLDVAAGTGEPGLSIARLAPNGRVVLTDLSPEMLHVASRRAAEQRLTNVETVVCSGDELPFGDATFDSVSVRFGYMFFPDMAAATAEFARVLKPGGRVAATVWIDPDANPWTSIPMDAIGTEVAMPPTDPDRPHMFRCAAPGFISLLYDGAGLGDVREWDVDVELVTQSAEQFWDMICDHVSLVAAALGQVDAEARERIHTDVVARVQAFERAGAFRVPGRARCIVGAKR